MISSQFQEEFMDGRKSFIFSWNKKHRAIHEEALLHYFDPSKKGQKFEYQQKNPPEVSTRGKETEAENKNLAGKGDHRYQVKQILAIQPFLVVYHRIFHEPFVLSRYTKEPKAINAVHDGKVGCNTVKYTAAVLYWLRLAVFAKA